MGLDYVDIFYSHRFDPDTPLEETMMALDHAVRSGKALYAGISSYNSQRTREAATILRELGTPLLIHQPSYSMINRWVEDDGLLDTLEGLGVGSIAFTPLAQGMLTDKYLAGIPEDSRAAQGKSLRQSFLNEQTIANISALNEIAEQARPDAGADGAGLGAAQRPRHHGADRRQPARADRGLRRRAEEPRLQRRRTRRDRPATRATATSICGPRRPNAQARDAQIGTALVTKPSINPILPGFNADPSICRVGEDYYIATSTFEWYPGVQIHHSTDLVNWRLVKRPLDRAAQLDMRGNPDSVRHLGAVPVLCRRAVLAGLYRRQALRRQLQGQPQLHRHRAGDRRAVVRSGLRQFERLRPFAVPRRRRPEMVPQHAVEPCLARRRRQPETPVLRRHPAAGI